jgi:DNA-directed RNA polymerase omega subunit
MIDQQIEKLLPKAGMSMYRLVRMAAARALELSEGKKNLIGAPKSAKVATVALKEISEGRVVAKENKDTLATTESSLEYKEE